MKLLIGNCNLNKHLHGIEWKPSLRACYLKDEMTKHLLCGYLAFAQLKDFFLEDLWTNMVSFEDALSSVLCLSSYFVRVGAMLLR